MVNFTLTNEEIAFLEKEYKEQPELQPIMTGRNGNAFSVSDDEYCDFIDWVETASVTDGMDADGEPDKVGLMLEEIYDTVYSQTN